MSLKDRALDAAASLIQSHAPINQLDLHLISLPCYTHNMHSQRLTHHYCHRIEEGFWQCVMFNGSDKNSRLIGVEWVIDESHWNKLPVNERSMWHSHHQEIAGGNTLAPSLPHVAEQEVMQRLANTYGKAIHFWDEVDSLPIGPPKLIMTLCTPQTQVKLMDKSIWRQKDETTNISSNEKAIQRQSLNYHDRLEGADQWQRGGKLYEFVLVPVDKSAEICEKFGGIRNEHRSELTEEEKQSLTNAPNSMNKL